MAPQKPLLSIKEKINTRYELLGLAGLLRVISNGRKNNNKQIKAREGKGQCQGMSNQGGGC